MPHHDLRIVVHAISGGTQLDLHKMLLIGTECEPLPRQIRRKPADCEELVSLECHICSEEVLPFRKPSGGRGMIEDGNMPQERIAEPRWPSPLPQGLNLPADTSGLWAHYAEHVKDVFQPVRGGIRVIIDERNVLPARSLCPCIPRIAEARFRQSNAADIPGGLRELLDLLGNIFR